MKQLIILAVSLFSFTATTQATPIHNDAVVTLTSVEAEKFHTIIIKDDIDVVLITNSFTQDITISGDEKFTSRVDYSISNGKLTIQSKKGFLKNKVVVYVPVNNLRVIKVNGRSTVTNKGFLDSALITVFINAVEAKVSLFTKGNVVFESDNDIDLMVQKWHPQAASN